MICCIFLPKQFTFLTGHSSFYTRGPGDLRVFQKIQNNDEYGFSFFSLAYFSLSCSIKNYQGYLCDSWNSTSWMSHTWQGIFWVQKHICVYFVDFLSIFWHISIVFAIFIKYFQYFQYFAIFSNTEENVQSFAANMENFNAEI